jgi:outer membrane protein OmpA-like peptidoglycan-associated protein
MALLGAATITSRAQAQTTTQTGWALNRYEPAPMGDAFFLAEHPWYSSTRLFSVGLYGDYANNPLRLDVFANPQSTTPTEVRENITGMFVLHVGAQVSFLDRVGVHVSLPVSLLQNGTTSGNAAALGVPVIAPADGPAVGDLRAGLRVRIFGHADRDAFSLHIGANLWAPIGSRASNTGDEAIRIEPRLTLAGRGGPVRWSFTGAFVVRSVNDIANLAFGNELRLTAGLGFVFAHNRAMIGPEAYVVSPIRDLTAAQGGGSALFAKNQWGGEVYLGASYLIADAFRVGVAAGPGIGTGPGIPDVRALFNLAYAPVSREAAGPVDTDGDGVFDPDDVCPTTPQGPTPDAARRGCPATDTDGDGVFDHEDQCVSEPMGATPDPARRGCPLRDRDGDGVIDPDDVCPDVAQGATPDPARRGCPAGDRDADGVMDHEDQCPDVPRMPFPDPARLGCALPDADHDQVPEPPDACPGVPGVPSNDPARNGCPSTDVQMIGGQILILEQVFFDTDRDTIKPRSFHILQAVADVLAAASHIRRVSVDGHTDNRSSEEHNLDLSQRRAAAVVRWLTAHGIDASRLEAHGYGPSRPIAPNATGAGRARNRRVEFVIIDPPQPRDVQTMVAPPPPDPPARVRRRRRH